MQRPLNNGSKRCRQHGGKSPRGIASPNFKHGKRSKYLPARLLERYNESVNDPNLLELRDEIAIVDARLADLLLRVDTGESGAIWKDLQAAYAAMMTARRMGNNEEAAEALNRIGYLIRHGYEDNAAWADVRATLLMRKSLVESERKRLVEMQQMIHADEAMTLMYAIAGLIKEHVKDRTALTAISDGLARLTTIDVGGTLT